MNKIDKLLKKGKGKLTGDEVGRLMIADLVECYKRALKGDSSGAGLFSDSEKAELVNGIEGRENIARYNQYRYLNDFLTRFPILLFSREQYFENYYFRLHSLLKTTRTAEDEYSFDWGRPLIVTEEEYKELAAEELENKKSWTYTPERLFFERLDAIMSDYQAGKRTGINAKIEETKSQPIRRERIKSNYWSCNEKGYYRTKDGKTEGEVEPAIWQSLLNAGELVFVEDAAAPENATAFDVLECAEGFYYSEETDSTETLAEFKEDFPAIWDFVWKKLTACKALSSLKAMSYKDYFKDCITLEELAKANAFDYREKFTEFSGVLVNGYMGVAVVKSSINNTFSERTEREKRLLYYPFLAESLLDDKTSEIIADQIASIKEALIGVYSYNAALDIIGEKLGIDGLDVFKTDTNRYSEMIDFMNCIFMDLHNVRRCGKVPGERPAKELNADLKELLKPIKIWTLQPSEEILARFKSELTLETLEGKGLKFTDEIIQAVKDSIDNAEEVE